MKRVIVVGVLGILVFLAGVKFGVSYFSDVAKSEGNQISTGDFDIGISRDGERFYDDYKLFSFDDLQPGEERTVDFYIKNRGDYPVSSVGMVFNVTDLEDGSLSKAEALVDKTLDAGELSKYLIIKDFRVSQDGYEEVLSDYIGKSLKELNMSELQIFSGSLPENGILKVTLTVQLSPSAGNDCLTDTSKIGILITAEQ
ncbi:TasA family protein [Thermococcus gorgonarius]|uniref:Methyltransferase n=1 Tax=Thermococcus gorgonarius TaxID=71997 RepID=A0A2Z2MD40_THEGO|nr:TasA family protein [Thermococcus gorgonarius]ASI99977.1 methyltransferase [Thermococcus gorgonarius]